jgi:hypothetical protein
MDAPLLSAATHHAWYEALLRRCSAIPAVPTAVVHPCDALSLGAAVDAAALQLIEPILVGPWSCPHQTGHGAGWI